MIALAVINLVGLYFYIRAPEARPAGAIGSKEG
jgi:hypothetical protein